MTITLTKGMKPQFAGRFSTNGDYTIDYTLECDRDTDTSGVAVFFNWGDTSAYLAYPNLVFKNKKKVLNVLLNDVIGYETIRPVLLPGQEYSDPHKITFRMSASVMEVLIDNIIVGFANGNFSNPVDADLYVSSDTPYYAMTGRVGIGFKSFYDSSHDKNMPQRLFDPLEFHPMYVAGSKDYSNVPRAIDQIKAAPEPNYHPTHKIPELSLCINLRYLCGYQRDTLTSEQLFSRVYEMQKELSTRFNYGIRLSDALEETYEEKRDGKPCLAERMAELAATLPDVRVDITTAWAHIRSTLPGNTGIVPIDKRQLSPDMLLSKLDPDVNIYNAYAQTIADICKAHGIKVGLHIENNEVGEVNFQTKVLDSVTGQYTYPEANHIKDSQAYTLIVNQLLSKLRAALPDLKISTEYDLHYPYWDLDQKLFEYRILISINGMGSCSMYCQMPWIWYDHAGAMRGIGFELSAKEGEISKGHPLSMPFISGGWANGEETWCGFAQLMSLYKLAFASGAYTAFPAFFTLTGSGATGVQKDESYAYQALAASFGQAPFSDPEVWDLIINGSLLPGDIREQYVNQGYGSYNSGSKAVKTIVRKHNTLNKYLIVTSHMQLHRYRSKVKKRVETFIILDGVKVSFVSKRQGCVYVYEPGKPLRWIDKGHLVSHIGWWNPYLTTNAPEDHDKD